MQYRNTVVDDSYGPGYKGESFTLNETNILPTKVNIKLRSE